MKLVVLLPFVVYVMVSSGITDAEETMGEQLGGYRLWYKEPIREETHEGEWGEGDLDFQEPSQQ